MLSTKGYLVTEWYHLSFINCEFIYIASQPLRFILICHLTKLDVPWSLFVYDTEFKYTTTHPFYLFLYFLSSTYVWLCRKIQLLTKLDVPWSLFVSDSEFKYIATHPFYLFLCLSSTDVWLCRKIQGRL